MPAGAHIGKWDLMSNNAPFVPAWAESVLGPKSALDGGELLMLREFFDAWEGLHKIPLDKSHRKAKEQAAQHLLDCANTIRRFRDGKTGKGLTLNGVRVTNG